MASLRNFIFKILMQNKVGYLFSNIEKLIPIIEEYNLIDSTDIFGEGNTLFLQKKRKIFKSTIDDKVSYNIFFDNIQIRMEISPKGTVYSIHLKKVGEPWQFNRDKKGTFDFSHPLTSTYRVYVGYFVPVLNITTVAGEQYTPGNWNEYVISKLYDDNSFISASDVPCNQEWKTDNRQQGWYFSNCGFMKRLDVCYQGKQTIYRGMCRYNITMEVYDQFLVIDGRRIDFLEYRPDFHFNLLTKDIPNGINGIEHTYECNFEFMGRNFYVAVINTITQL